MGKVGIFWSPKAIAHQGKLLREHEGTCCSGALSCASERLGVGLERASGAARWLPTAILPVAAAAAAAAAATVGRGSRAQRPSVNHRRLLVFRERDVRSSRLMN